MVGVACGVDRGRHTMHVVDFNLTALLGVADLLSRLIGVNSRPILSRVVVRSEVRFSVTATLLTFWAQRRRHEVGTCLHQILLEGVRTGHFLLRELSVLMSLVKRCESRLRVYRVCSRHSILALTRLHHGQDLGEALSVLNSDSYRKQLG